MTKQSEGDVPVSYDVPVFHTDHNVYILGAGYSAGAGLPLLTNFLEKMRCYRSTLKNGDINSAPIDAGYSEILSSCGCSGWYVHSALDRCFPGEAFLRGE
jgi:hypothetical protein